MTCVVLSSLHNIEVGPLHIDDAPCSGERILDFGVAAHNSDGIVDLGNRMRLFIRSIDIKCPEATIVMAEIAHNLGRWRWWQARAAPA